MEKIKKSLRKEDGFTLVELLAVIVILGIIVAIAIPAIGNVIQRAESGASEAEKELVVDAARLYVTIEKTAVATWNLTADAATYEGLTVQVLKDAGYLDERASSISVKDYVLITRVGLGDIYNYTYEYKSGS